MKSPGDQDLVLRCLDQLRKVPFIQGIRPIELSSERRSSTPAHSGQPDATILQLETPTGTHELQLEVYRSHLTRTIVDGILARVAQQHPDGGWMLFAPHVGRTLGAYLAEQGANYIDPAGNCHLQLGDALVARVEGRPLERPAKRGRAMGTPGYRVLFAILVRRELLGEPIRTLAAAAEVAPGTAANSMAQLREEGLIHDSRTGRKLTDARKLFQRWLRGYETVIRPKLLIGNFRVPDQTPEELEHRIENELNEDTEPWAFGGTTAAFRLTNYYRDERTVLYLSGPWKDATGRLRAIRSEDGPLTLLRVPSKLAFQSNETRTVVPLLVYSELLHEGDRRSLEAANEVMSGYLQEFVD